MDLSSRHVILKAAAFRGKCSPYLFINHAMTGTSDTASPRRLTARLSVPFLMHVARVVNIRNITSVLNVST
jgi:hypothetical protein